MRARDDATGTDAGPLPGMLKRTTISAAWLRRQAVCPEGFKRFRATFRDSPVPITAEVFDRAAEAGLDLDWAARQLLTAAGWRAFEQAAAPAQRAFEEAIHAGWRAFEQAAAGVRRPPPAAWQALEQARAAGWLAYLEAVRPVLRAVIFGDAGGASTPSEP